MLRFEKARILQTMAAKKKQNLAGEQKAAKNFPNELKERVWSVISFEKCEAENLTYAEAEQMLNELEAQNISGLCIVTDEAAGRIAGKS